MKPLLALFLFALLFSACAEPESSTTSTPEQPKEEMITPPPVEEVTTAEQPTEQPTETPIDKPAIKPEKATKPADKTPDKPKTDPVKEEVKKEEAPKTAPPVVKEPEVVKEKVEVKISAESFKFSSGEMKIDGTSTLHAWEMVASSFSAEAMVLLNASNELSSIESLTLTLPVKNLKHKDNKLNENAWETLKADQHKNIVFKLSKATITPQQGNAYQVKATGSLTISGVTREISLDAACRVGDNKSLTFTGTKVIKMTDHGVKPPSFMLGAMKTGDNVTLNFKVVMSR
ncbi:MAG: YceI family protein [Saprospirales bacterium]|nr:YceI family protein [Saprospirales bacterium]